MKSNAKDIDAAEALKHFKGRDIKVQVATAGTVKGSDGKTREGYTVADAPLAAEHVVGAREYSDRIVIVTLDGQRHEAPKAAGKAAA